MWSLRAVAVTTAYADAAAGCSAALDDAHVSQAAVCVICSTTLHTHTHTQRVRIQTRSRPEER